MIKDSIQKIKAGRYIIDRGWLPIFEVSVRYDSDVNESPLEISDIDVLCIRMSEEGDTHRIIFDCKTASRSSPINRALWASGISRFIGAEYAFVIQKKTPEQTHKLAAKELSVLIFDEDGFEKYAFAEGKSYSIQDSYCLVPDNWRALSDVSKNNPGTQPLCDFLRAAPASEKDARHGVRAIISHLKGAAGEINPKNKYDFFIVAQSLCFFFMFMHQVVNDIKYIFQFDMNKPEFEKLLRYYIWQGRDNYELRRKLKASISRNGDSEKDVPFDLPAWDNFVQLVRLFLEAPNVLAKMSVVCTEIAYRALSQHDVAKEEKLINRINENDRSRQFITHTARYLQKSCGLPHDWISEYERVLKSLVK